MKPLQRTRELAFLLPLCGLLLLMPPYVAIFDVPAYLAGVPILPAYIFAVWTALILLAAAVSRHLCRNAPRPEDEGD